MTEHEPDFEVYYPNGRTGGAAMGLSMQLVKNLYPRDESTKTAWEQDVCTDITFGDGNPAIPELGE